MTRDDAAAERRRQLKERLLHLRHDEALLERHRLAVEERARHVTAEVTARWHRVDVRAETNRSRSLIGTRLLLNVHKRDVIRTWVLNKTLFVPVDKALNEERLAWFVRQALDEARAVPAGKTVIVPWGVQEGDTTEPPDEAELLGEMTDVRVGRQGGDRD